MGERVTVPADEDTRPLRLFVTLELPDEVRRALTDTITVLRDAGVDEGLRWARPESVHLTLKFLGAVSPDRVDAIAAALEGVAASASPIALQVGGLGAFHGGRGVVRGHAGRESYHHNLRVLWVGLDGEVLKVGALAAQVDVALAALEAALEKRPFFPHLTIARMRERADRQTRERAYAALRPFLARGHGGGREEAPLVPMPPRFEAARIALMQSMPTGGGVVHRALATFRLGG